MTLYMKRNDRLYETIELNYIHSFPEKLKEIVSTRVKRTFGILFSPLKMFS